MHQNNLELKQGALVSDTQQNLGFVDALRGLAILMVIITHVSAAAPGVSEFIPSLLSYGRMGVQLFFVLSAFTLCFTFANRINEPYSVGKFYVRRYFRIAPMYYLGILLYSGILVFERGLEHINYASIGWHFSLLHGFNMDVFNKVVPGGWSIGVECIFYLIFPFLFTRIHESLRTIIIVFILSIFVSLCLYAYLMFYLKLNITAYSLGYWNFVNQFPVFIVGFFLYFCYRNSNRELSPILLCAIFFGASAVSLSLYMLKPLFNVVFIPVVSAISFGALFFLFSRCGFLANSILQKIGKVSFSMYLIHFVVLDKVGDAGLSFLPPNIQFVFNYCLISAITYLLARVTYNYIEHKGIAMAKRITNRF